jgi:FtsZ-binding cell division protein ZapB
MAMESILERLETRIEQLVEAHEAARSRTAELEQRVEELEAELAERSEASERAAELESQRAELAERLEKVLGRIDEALEQAGDDEG